MESSTTDGKTNVGVIIINDRAYKLSAQCSVASPIIDREFQVEARATGYTFKNWTVVWGDVTIENFESAKTTMIVRSDSLVRAVYKPSVSSLQINAYSPVNIMATDPSGLRIGLDPETMSIFNEIPGATYSGPNSEPQVVAIPNPIDGDYTVLLIGTATGTYSATIELITLEGRVEQTYVGDITEGETLKSVTTVSENKMTSTPPIPVYALTITSFPITGIPFTINGINRTTPYTDWLPQGSYALETPEIYDEYLWSHWLEDGDENRTKTVTLPPECTWIVVYSPISWEYVFEDERRNTMLKISTDDKYFHFIAPNKKFSVKHDPNMIVTTRLILMNFKDNEIKLHATAIIMRRWSFCIATATDIETGNRYLLIDIPKWVWRI